MEHPPQEQSKKTKDNIVYLMTKFLLSLSTKTYKKLFTASINYGLSVAIHDQDLNRPIPLMGSHEDYKFIEKMMTPRDKIIEKLMKTVFKFASPWYRGMIYGSFIYGRIALVRDTKMGWETPKHWKQVIDEELAEKSNAENSQGE